MGITANYRHNPQIYIQMAKAKNVAPEATANVENVENVNAEGSQPEAQNEAQPEPQPEETSPKLLEIRASFEPLSQAIASKKVMSPEWLEANMALVAAMDAEKAEIIEIGKAKKAREAAEAQNARIAIYDNGIEAFRKSFLFDLQARGLDLDSLAPVIPAEHHEQSNALNAEFKALRQDAVNELLKSVPRGTPSKSVATGQTSGKRGGITAEIRELTEQLYNDGKSASEVRAIIIKEKGYNDGTANAAIRAYEIEKGLK